MLETQFSAVVGAVVWGLANVVYYRMARRGERGFGRFAAFWVGNPTTWITLFWVREEKRPNFEAHGDDTALLAEVRRDRALREAGHARPLDDDAPPIEGARARDPTSGPADDARETMPSRGPSR